LADAILAHNNVSVTGTDLANLVAYVQEIGSQEISAPTSVQNAGNGLVGQYFNNMTLAGSVVLQRIEAVNFNWGSGSPGTGVNKDKFSVRWTGTVEASSTGDFQFQTNTDDGVRLWVNGVQVISNWTNHAATLNTSAAIAMIGGTRYTIKMEFYENGGQAVSQLRWKTPGATSYVAIPVTRLYTN
jgi:hypothetical protein